MELLRLNQKSSTDSSKRTKGDPHMFLVILCCVKLYTEKEKLSPSYYRLDLQEEVAENEKKKRRPRFHCLKKCTIRPVDHPPGCLCWTPFIRVPLPHTFYFCSSLYSPSPSSGRRRRRLRRLEKSFNCLINTKL